MRIDFDAGNANELAAVAALISSLRGESFATGSLAAPTTESVAEPIAEIAESLPTPAPVAAPPLPTTVAPPPAVPAAPPAPIASPAPSAAPTGVEVDADGLPWDNRIHSTPATKKKDGKWRGKRGLDDATRVAVTAELKATMAAPAPGVVPAAPPPMFEESAPGVPLPPTAEPDNVDASTAFGAAAATPVSSVPPAPPVAVPPAPVAAVPPAPAPAPAPAGEQPATDFATLMRKITARQTAGTLTVAQTAEIATSLGITGVRDLMHRPDLIPSFDALLPAA